MSVCNNQLLYLWNSNNYNATGTYAITLVNAASCDSVATLNLSLKQTTTSITNVSVCNNQLPYLWNSNTYNTAGTYAVNLIAASGCDSISEERFAVNAVKSRTTPYT